MTPILCSFVRSPPEADDRSFAPTSFHPSDGRSEAEGVIAGDPSARREATEAGGDHPLPRSEHGGSLDRDGKVASWLSDKRPNQLD